MVLELLATWGASEAWETFGPVLKDLAGDVAKDAAKSYVGKCFGSVYSPIHRGPLTKATGRAVKELLELLENELLDVDMGTEDLIVLRTVVARFLDKKPVQKTIGSLFLEPGYYLDPAVLARAWNDTNDAPQLPEYFSWQRIAKRFSRKVTAIRNGSTELRETFDALLAAQNTDTLKELAGLPLDFDLEKYREALVERFGNLSFDSLDTSGAYYSAVRLWSVFVPQSVRECHTYRPQLLEMPKEHQQLLIDRGEIDAKELEKLEKERDEQRTAYFDQSPRPALEVCADADLMRMVILGDPGSGKSSLLRYLALEWARDEDANRRYSAPLPLLIELRDYNRWQCTDGMSFSSYLHQASTWHRLNQQTLDFLLKQPDRVVLLLDGLDEVFDKVEREQVINDIHRFSNDYPHTRIILTSRVVGYQPQRLHDAEFQDFMLQDLEPEKIDQFLQGWHEVTFEDKAEAELKRERLARAIREAKSIAILAGNPLLLTMMVIINRYQELPRDRVLLYEKAAELLLQQWDTERSLQDFPGLSAEIDLCAKFAILRKIAFTMQTGNDAGKAANIIQGDLLIDLIEEYLRKELHFDQARGAAAALVQQLRERNFILCFLGADSYGFVHRTFLEYFCAAELVHRFHKEKSLDIDGLIEVFDQHCREDDWREVLRLICGQIDETFVGQIIEHLIGRVNMEYWDGRTPLPDLALAIWCLSEVRNPNRLEKAGSGLLLTVIDCFLQGKEGITESFVLQLVAAGRDVGLRWPGKSIFHFYGQYSKTDQYYHHWYKHWPFFLVAVFEQRLWIEQLSQCRRWAVRCGSLEVLVEYWPDADTRKLITKRAVKDENDNPRSTALELLAKTWPDDDSRRLITERAPIEGAAASLYGKSHSHLGKVVFQIYPGSGIGYLNPRKPIPPEHIQQAAKKANIPPHQIDETIRSLSKHLGWDITKGSQPD